jgi:tetratricopeptide (TPR) repeat protein
MRYLLLGLFLIHSVLLIPLIAQQESLQMSTITVGQNINNTTQQQKTITTTSTDISEMLNKLSVEISSISQTTVLLAKYYVLLSKRMEEMMKRYDEIMSMLSSFEVVPAEGEAQKSSSSQNVFTQSQPSITSGSPQYVKVKVKDRGQEMEFNLDPTYIDMNLELKRKIIEETTQQVSTQKGQKEQQKQLPQSEKEELMKYVESSIKSLENRQDVTQVIPKDVLSDLFTAQKLFYKKRYNEALKMVQRSLAKQETAIGYSIEGSLYFVLGDIESAVSSWNRALELDPNMDDVREALYRYTRSRFRTTR